MNASLSQVSKLTKRVLALVLVLLVQQLPANTRTDSLEVIGNIIMPFICVVVTMHGRRPPDKPSRMPTT